MFKLPEDIGCKYAFVTLAAKRAEQLQMGAVPRVTAPTNKVTVIAQKEVALGYVCAIDPDREPEGLETEEEE